MILNAAVRAAYAKAISIDTQIDARVIRADGSAVPTTAAEGEALKDSAERAWADYREEKDAMTIVGNRVRYWEDDHEEAGEIRQYDDEARRIVVEWDNPLPWMKHGMSEVCLDSDCLLNRAELGGR